MKARVKCPLSGVVVSAIPREDWARDEPYKCHACGQLVTYRVRGTDLPGTARLHTHTMLVEVWRWWG